jgi:thioredoxin-related protein
MKSFLFLFIPLLSIGQESFVGPAINFEKELNWQQILIKAKQENKYIFIDCSATWCLPCKKMEKEVFSQKNVADFINSHFVSVQVQMDTTNDDSESIKKWYKDAHDLKDKYNVSAYPTYLFFSPQGEIVHRYLFAMPDSLFFKVAENALDTNKQYYTLLNKYLTGQKQYERILYLANISKSIGDDTTAQLIATDYLHNYLNILSEKEFFQKKNIDFVSTFSNLLTSRDRTFALIYKNLNKTDKLIKRNDFSKNLIFSVITNEEIDPLLWPNKVIVSLAPNWNQLKKAIAEKYDKDIAELVVVNAQIKWYTKKKDKQQQMKYSVEKFERFGIDTAGVGWAIFNNLAFELFFRYCNSKDTLNKVIKWMEMVNKSHPDDQANMDTYANLLYKVGRAKEAIQWEEKAAQIEDKAAQKENREVDKSFRETLDKMRSGIPTWVVK